MAVSPISDFRLLQSLWADAPQRFVLANGLTVLLKPDAAAAIASVQVWVKTGSIHEDEQLGAGLSHYLEHLLFKGTERRDGREISTEVQAHGGYINAYTSFERTVYYIDIPAENAPVAIDVLGDAVLHSTLPADEVEREKQVILREIDMGLDDPEQRLWQALFESAFREHPYRQPIIGHRDVFSEVNRKTLVDYYERRYVPNNMVLVVTGGFDAAAVRQAIDTHFGAVPRRRLSPVFIPNEPAALASRTHQIEDDVEIVRGGLAWAIPGLTHRDAASLDVLAMILGHGDSSVLWQNLREKARLVHSIDAVSWNPGAHGLFYLSIVCDPEQRDAALKAIDRELRSAHKRGFTATEIRKAVRQLVMGEINGRKTVAGQASRLGVAEVVAGDIDFSRGYFERLKSVTPARLRQVLQTYLLEGHPTTVTLNPRPAEASSDDATAEREQVAPEAVRKTLPNGARLVLQRDARIPNLHFRLLVRGGGAYEPTDQRGATALMATMLARDTSKRSAAEVAEAIETVGGSLYPVSGNNTAGLAVEVLPSDVDLALELLADAALRPTFKAASVGIERDAQIADLQQEADDIGAIGRKQLRRYFFGQHPLAVESQGDIDDLRRIKARDLKALHRRLMVAPNVVLSVAGDFEPEALTPKLSKLLQRFPSVPAPDPVTAPAGPVEVGDFVQKLPRQQAVVFQGYAGPGVRSDDFYQAEVANELFSGMSSRLFERVREEKGLAYYVRSSQIIGLDDGMFYFFAGTAPGKEAEVLKEVELEIARMAKGRILKKELARCQVRLCAARRMQLQTNSSRAMHAALNEHYQLPLDDGTHYESAVNAVTVKTLAEFARRRLSRKACTQLIVGP